MGNGPDVRYHLGGNGCPQSDDFSRGCRWDTWREVRHLDNFLNCADHVGKLVERLSKTGGQRLRLRGRGALTDFDESRRSHQERSARRCDAGETAPSQ